MRQVVTCGWMIGSTCETKDDYLFGLESMRIGFASVAGINDYNYLPFSVVADGTPSATTAIEEFWGIDAPRRIMCWFHMKKNVMEELRGTL